MDEQKRLPPFSIYHNAAEIAKRYENEPLIHLRTESGKWSFYALKRNDPVFSQLIPDLEDVPDELILTSSVAQILEEDWCYFEKLAKFRTLSNNTLYTRIFEDVMQSKKSNDILALSECIVTLESLDRVSRLINMPINYQLATVVTESTPIKTKKIHLVCVGVPFIPVVVVMNAVTRLVTVLSCKTRNGLSEYSMSILREILESLKDRDGRDTAEVLGHIYNGVLRTMALGHRKKGGISWKMVLWKDLIGLINPLHTSLLNTVKLLAGEGDIQGPSYSLLFDMYSEEDIQELYQLLLRQYPNDVRAGSLGLQSILASGSTIFETIDGCISLTNLVPYIHFQSLSYDKTSLMGHNIVRRRVHNEQIPYLIKQLALYIGSEGANAILKSLEDNNDERAKVAYEALSDFLDKMGNFNGSMNAMVE